MAAKKVWHHIISARNCLTRPANSHYANVLPSFFGCLAAPHTSFSVQNSLFHELLFRFSLKIPIRYISVCFCFFLSLRKYRILSNLFSFAITLYKNSIYMSPLCLEDFVFRNFYAYLFNFNQIPPFFLCLFRTIINFCFVFRRSI